MRTRFFTPAGRLYRNPAANPVAPRSIGNVGPCVIGKSPAGKSPLPVRFQVNSPRSLIEGLVHTEEENPDPVEYKRLADSIYASILSDEIENGKEFCLRDISKFSNICVASAKQGKVSVETVRARIGKVWNAKVAHGKYPGVERAKTDKGALKFDCGAAVYRKVV